MATEGFDAVACCNVPDTEGFVATSGDEEIA